MLGAHSRRFGLWSRVEGPESFRGPSSKRGLSISALSCIRISQRGAETRKGGESGLPSSRTRKKLAHLQVNFSLGSEARRRIGGAGFPVGGKESGGEQDSEEAGRRRGGEGSEGLSWGGTGEISGDAFKESGEWETGSVRRQSSLEEHWGETGAWDVFATAKVLHLGFLDLQGCELLAV